MRYKRPRRTSLHSERALYKSLGRDLAREAQESTVDDAMKEPISEHMRRAIAVIHEHGGSATPEGGGWWKGADGKRLSHEHIKLGAPYTEVVTTNTIYALTRRGLLKRTGKHPQAWRDTYVEVPE